MSGALTRMLGRQTSGGGGGGGGVWTTVFSATSTAGNNGWQGFTMRQRIPASQLLDVAGTQIRFTFLSTGGGGISYDKMYFNPAAVGTYDFSAAPTQVLFGGSASGSCGAGSTITTDGIAYAYDGTVDLLLSMFHTISPSVSNYTVFGSPSGFANGFKSGDDAVTTLGSGYSNTSVTNFVKLVEVLV